MQTITFTEPIDSMEWSKEYTDEEAIKYGDRKKEMTRHESAIVCGLIKARRPRKILEIGVAAGGTSALILKTFEILGMDASRLFACDYSSKYYGNKSLDVGYMVEATVPHLSGRYTLYPGDVITEFLPKIGYDIDFLILDTMHKMPGECLDFLAVFYHLSPGCTVCLHDTGIHYLLKCNAIATKLLYSCVCADKLLLSDPNNPLGIPNISAFYITPDTGRYIANVLDALELPWTYMPPKEQLAKYDAYMLKSYSPELYSIFRKAVLINESRLGSN